MIDLDFWMLDVIIVGNALFRRAVSEHLDDYKTFQLTKDRIGMAHVVQQIIDHVHASGGRFIDQNWRGMVCIFCYVLLL